METWLKLWLAPLPCVPALSESSAFSTSATSTRSGYALLPADMTMIQEEQLVGIGEQLAQGVDKFAKVSLCLLFRGIGPKEIGDLVTGLWSMGVEGKISQKGL